MHLEKRAELESQAARFKPILYLDQFCTDLRPNHQFGVDKKPLVVVVHLTFVT